jgi:hypothetical protein
MNRLFAIALLSGVVAIGCAGNTKASTGGTEELARTPSIPANQNETGKATPHQTTAYESEATGGSVLGGGSSETATGTPGVPDKKTWSRKSGANKNVSGQNISNTGQSGTPAGTEGAPQPK